MQQHPIEGLMSETMEQLKNIIDVKTIIGDPIQTPDGSTIIPISKVSFGFAAGGSEFPDQKNSDQEQNNNEESTLPFGGGSGGGVSIIPIAFLVTHKQGNEIIHLRDQNHLYDKLIEVAPQAVEKIKEMLEQKKPDHDN
ncbi:GerW family sporulation protein [Amphibacillus sp. Q70]|uniref:GerW family sporulation protein n=1 Tax=Amphibacillus sp. Q70 TaxID=3453416 RepID=UPI003F84E1CD